jgi:hypothetical protein
MEDQIMYLSPKETYDVAIIGECASSGRVIYSKMKILDILAESMDHDSEEDRYESAIEFFEYNVLGSYVGTGTPIYLVEHEEVEHD